MSASGQDTVQTLTANYPLSNHTVYGYYQINEGVIAGGGNAPNCYIRDSECLKKNYHFMISSSDSQLYGRCSSKLIKSVLSSKKNEHSGPLDLIRSVIFMSEITWMDGNKLFIYITDEDEVYVNTPKGVFKMEFDPIEILIFYYQYFPDIIREVDYDIEEKAYNYCDGLKDN